MRNIVTLLNSVLLICCVLSALTAGAQELPPAEAPKGFHPELHAGVTMGGHLYNGRFIYRTGKVLQLGGSAAVGERIWLGISAGAEKFEDELFLPVALSFTGMLSKDASSAFLTTQAGYSAGMNSKLYSYANYDYAGGWMFSQGAGYQFPLKHDHAILLSAGYKHQFAHISYFTADNRVYRESDNFNLFYFRIGFRL